MTEVRIVARDDRDSLGEGPHWSTRDQALYWVDIFGQAVRRYRPADGQVSSWFLPERIGWIVERRRGGFIAGLKSGFAELTLEPLLVTPLGDPEPEHPDNRLNDAKVDAAGRIWAGTKDDTDTAESGALWRLDPDRSWRLGDGGYRVANGPAFSLGGETLFHTDSGRRTVYRFDLGGDGVLANRRPFIVFPDNWGYPDGMTTDAEGCLWIAHWGGGRISRFDPDGAHMRSIALPASNITSCAFGGAELDRLFVTSAAQDAENEAMAGALFELDPGARGLAAHLYGG